jgi:hypothetical protein
MKLSDLPGLSSGGVLVDMDSMIFSNKGAKLKYFRPRPGIFQRKSGLSSREDCFFLADFRRLKARIFADKFVNQYLLILKPINYE